jgi:hypothetical protein
MTEMKKSFVHLLTGAVLIQTLMGSSPAGEVATVAVVSPSTAKEIIVGSVDAIKKRLTLRWKAPDPPKQKPIQKSSNQTN